MRKYRDLFIKEMNKIVRRIRNKYLPSKIILFGSLVKGKITRDSDIDLIVIKKTTKEPWQRQKEIDNLVEHNLPVDILVYTPDEIRQRLNIGDFFVEDFIKYGRVVYEQSS